MGAVVAMGILGLVVFGVGNVTLQYFSSHRQVLGQDGYLAYDRMVSSLTSKQVGEFFEANAPANCATFTPAFQDSWVPYTGQVATAELVGSSQLASQLAIYSSAASPVQAAAVTRCTNYQTWANTSDLSTGQSVYFCLLLQKIAGTGDPTLLPPPGGTVSQIYPVFAEINYQLTDFQSYLPLTCANFKTASARGGIINYTIYWTTESGPGQYQFRNFRGMLHAPSN